MMDRFGELVVDILPMDGGSGENWVTDLGRKKKKKNEKMKKEKEK